MASASSGARSGPLPALPKEVPKGWSSITDFFDPLKKVQAIANPVEVPLVYAMAPDSEEDIDEEDNEGGEDD